MFAVGKTGGNRQRKVWDGGEVSKQASAPPCPHRLANPSSFLDLDVAPDEELYFSKRDAATFFDVLRAPKQLRPFFAEPPIAVHELLHMGGMSLPDVAALVEDAIPGNITEKTLLHPVHIV